MKSVFLLLSLVCAFLSKPTLFKPAFLSLKLKSDMNGDGEITYNEIDPPAGHGLPEFSMPVEFMTADQLILEVNNWKMSEAAAEEVFYAQTDLAVAEAKQDMLACREIADPDEQQACIDEAQDTIDNINDMISDLQTEHAMEEEAFDEAIEAEIKNKKKKEALEALLLTNGIDIN